MLPIVAATLPAAPLLGIAPSNILLALALVSATVLDRTWIRRAIDAIPRSVLASIVALITIRLVSASVAADPAVAFRHCAKDWRFVALLLAASGFLDHAKPAHRTPVFLVALLANVLWGVWLTSRIRWSYQWRTGSFLSHPMTEGSVMMLALLGGPMILVSRWPSRLAQALAFLGLALSNTKSAVTGWLAGAAASYIRHPKKTVRAGLAFVALASSLFLHPGVRMRVGQVLEQGLTAPSIRDRLALWHAAAELGTQHPLLGVGPGHFGRYAMNDIPGIGRLTHAHSNLLAFFAETGIPGLLALVMFFATLAYRFFSDTTAEGRTGLALVTAYFVAGLAEFNFYDGEPAILWFLLLGHCLSYAQLRRHDAATEYRP